MKRTRIVFAMAALLGAAPAAAADLRICVEGAYPPFSQTDDKGEIVGFDIDIANALCDAMGESCVMVRTEWDAIIPALEEGKCDAIIASMSITPERRQRIDFSEKYYQDPARLVAAEGANFEDSAEGLAGRTICVQRATLHQGYAAHAYPKSDIRLYPTQEEANLDLVAGRCDLLMADGYALQAGFLDTPDGRGYAFFGRPHLDPAHHGEGAGVAVRKSDATLRDAFSTAIRTIRENGVYKSVNDRYFPYDIYGD